jgi:anti-sigma factor RsiW
VSDLSCAEFVEEITDLLEGTLDDDARRRLVDHLPTCDGCARYLDQFRQSIRAIGQLPAQNLPAPARDALRATFRNRPS